MTRRNATDSGRSGGRTSARTRLARTGKPTGTDAVRLYGRHAVHAALDNPARIKKRLHGTKDALDEIVLDPAWPVTFCDAADLKRLVPDGAPTQGLVLDTAPLEPVWLGDVLAGAGPTQSLMVLDQVTDPHNVGAILRSAAALDAAAVITQDRHSPPETGALAKAASGCLELIPWVRVTNIARALEEIAEAGFWRLGLDGEAGATLEEALGDSRACLVLGAEGEGLRRNVAEHCDQLARLPMRVGIESLNVSNAAAIALYAARRRF